MNDETSTKKNSFVNASILREKEGVEVVNASRQHSVDDTQDNLSVRAFVNLKQYSWVLL